MSALDLRHCTERAMEALALNQAQHARLYNPTPEVDSLIERLVTLAAHGVPASAIRELVDDVCAVITLNAQEGREEHGLAGALDDLARIYHALERGAQQALTIRGLARQLSADLATIQQGGRAKDYTAACLRVQDVVRQASRERLLSDTLRHEIGAARHDLLTEFVRRGAQA